MEKRIVAVTGASGVIGKVVVKKLLERGCIVRAFVRNESSFHWQMDEKLEIIRGDINDNKILYKLFTNTYGIIHLAVEMDSSLPWKTFKDVNIDSVKTILKLAPKTSRLLLASSVVVYSDTGKDARDEKWDLKKSGGVDKYIRSKLLALKLTRNSKRKVITVMPSTVIDHEIFGREQFMTTNPIIKWLWNNVGGGIPGGLMAAVGDRGRIMNFVEVRDVAEGIILALEKGKLGEEYILSGESITTGDYLEEMSKRCGKSYLKIRIPRFCLRLFGLGEVVNMNFTYEKAKRYLGYTPKWKL
ncbi:NAD-dependent epimerase/dehydratase family protein [Candidatus Shapirobacteria bacterium]|nr:NAD-dependent epimerase/dehydratase family protein [Candidatus Shapirobacteria bacterium]